MPDQSGSRKSAEAGSLERKKSVVLGALVLLVGCGGGGGGGGCNPFGGNLRLVECKHDDPTKNKTFCVNYGVCSDSPAETCAWNIDADESKFPEYVGSEFPKNGTCDLNNLDEGVLAGSVSPDCLHPAGSPDGGETPTTGDDGSTSASDSTGDDPTGDVPSTYLCSTQAPDKCQGQSPAPPFDVNVCWSDTVNSAPCVQATSAANALAPCQTDCIMKDGDLSKEATDADPSRSVLTHLDCDLSGLGEGPTLLADNLGWSCSTESLLLPWGGVSSVYAASMGGSMQLANGTSARISGVRGYIGYSVTGCAEGVCDFVVDALEGFEADYSGNFMDATGTPGTYDLFDLDFQATHSLRGELYESRGAIVFPKSVGVGRFWIEGGAIDLVPLTGQMFPTMFVDEMVGTLNPTTGQLTLNFLFSGVGGSGSATLVTD